MKIVLTGATGFIGSEVLAQLVNNDQVLEIVVISRRALPSTPAVFASSKIQTIIHDDFSSWPNDLLSRIGRDADACIWALGVAFSSIEIQRRVNFEYTLAAAEAFAKFIPPKKTDGTDRKFRFVYVSGILTEKNQQRSLWWGGEGRRMRGQIENRLLQLARDDDPPAQTLPAEHPNQNNISTYVARPAAVVRHVNASFLQSVLLYFTNYSVRVDSLAAHLINAATRTQSPAEQKGIILENHHLNGPIGPMPLLVPS